MWSSDQLRLKLLEPKARDKIGNVLQLFKCLILKLFHPLFASMKFVEIEKNEWLQQF